MIELDKSIDKLKEAVAVWAEEKPDEYAEVVNIMSKIDPKDPKINFKAVFVGLDEISDKGI